MKVHFYQCQNVTREKLRKALSYEKGARKVLMKLTPGIHYVSLLLFEIW